MYEVTVEAGFSSGHYLRNYRGKCENPHGHNYKVRVTLRGKELDVAGLLLDFKQLKQVMRPVIDRLDHQMINDLEPFTVINPSAENLSRYFFDETNRQLSDMTGGRVQVVANGYPYIAGYDFRTGKELWRLKSGGDIPVPTPFLAHGLIYVANAHGDKAPLYAIRPDAAVHLVIDR